MRRQNSRRLAMVLATVLSLNNIAICPVMADIGPYYAATASNAEWTGEQEVSGATRSNADKDRKEEARRATLSEADLFDADGHLMDGIVIPESGAGTEVPDGSIFREELLEEDLLREGMIPDGMIGDGLLSGGFVPTVSYIDEFGEPLDGPYAEVALPDFEGDLVLDDPENAPVDDVIVRGGYMDSHRATYSYLRAEAEGTEISAIRKTIVTEMAEPELPEGMTATAANALRGPGYDPFAPIEVETAEYSYTADGEQWTEITEDTELLFVFKQEGLPTYVYEDDDVIVTAQPAARERAAGGRRAQGDPNHRKYARL